MERCPFVRQRRCQTLAILRRSFKFQYRPTLLVHIAPVVTLEGRECADARSGRTSRYARLDDDQFADLAVVATVTRESLLEQTDTRTPMSTGGRQAFATCISRRFARFAYPDDIVEVLRPLSTRIREKALKSGFTGEVLGRVVTMRLECEPDWDAPNGLDLTLLVLVSPEFLPSVNDFGAEPDDAGPQLMRKQGLNGAAEAILKCETHDHRLSDLWNDFGQELLLLFQSGLSSAPAGYIDDVQVEVLRTDELNYERYRNTVDLDFDYLSMPHNE